MSYPSIDEILTMKPEEFAKAWENGDVHRASYDSLGIAWEEVPEEQDTITL